jgi:TonB family protein
MSLPSQQAQKDRQSSIVTPSELLTHTLTDTLMDSTATSSLQSEAMQGSPVPSSTAVSIVLNPLGYGATELKEYINKSTLRGFTTTVIAASLLLGGYALAINLGKSASTKMVTVNKMKLSQLPPPPAQEESTPPPPPPTTIAGPAARAGTPVPVPDALVTPDMKDFANVDEVSRASTTGGDGQDQGFLGLSKDVEVEVRDNEPDAYDFVSVEKEPYIDLNDLQKRVVYPEIARRAGIEGKVNIRVLVGKNGKPRKCLVESSDSELLNQAAITAVMASVFTPAILANQPLDCWVSIPINFRMK